MLRTLSFLAILVLPATGYSENWFSSANYASSEQIDPQSSDFSVLERPVDQFDWLREPSQEVGSNFGTPDYADQSPGDAGTRC